MTEDGTGERTADRTAAWRAVLRAQDATLRAIERDLDAAGKIPLHWYDVLLELNAARGRRLRIQELAGRVVLTRTRVSRLVDRLATAGLVQRQADPEDGRASFAVITAEGRKALRDAAPVYLEGIERHFTRHLTQEQVRVVSEALQQVVSAHRLQPAPRSRQEAPLGPADDRKGE
jgi:DNA-binding MarR family transcriptional regulator